VVFLAVDFFGERLAVDLALVVVFLAVDFFGERLVLVAVFFAAGFLVAISVAPRVSDAGFLV
jgi:hypothetical protein